MGDGRISGKFSRNTARLVIFFCLLIGGTTDLFGQVSWITESIIPSQIEVDTVALLRISILFPQSELVIVEEPELPEGLELESGPFIRPVRLEGKTIIEFSVIGKEPGRYILPQIKMKLPEVEWMSQPLALFVIEDPADETAPVDLLWQIPFVQMYEGQALPVTIWADMIGPEEPDIDLQIAPPADVVVRPLENPDSSFPMNTVNMHLFRTALSSRMYILPKPGLVTIPRQEVAFDGGKAVLPQLQLYAYPFPETPEGIEAAGIGDFTFTVGLNKKMFQDFILVTVEMEYQGDGNLVFLQFPEPETQNLQSLTSVDEEKYEPLFSFPYGYTGIKKRTVTFRQENTGPVEVGIPDVLTFNPMTATYRVHPGIRERYEMDSPAWTDQPPEELYIPEIPLPGQLKDVRIMRVFADKKAFLLFIPALIIFVVSLCLPKRKRLSIFSLLILFAGCTGAGQEPEDMKNGSFLYTRGYELIMEGEYGEGLYYLRRLHRLKPMNTELIEIIREVERGAGIERQIPARWFPHPDIFFWLSVLSAYGAAAVSFIGYIKKDRKRRVPVCLLLAFLCSLGTLLFFARKVSSPQGVVKSDTTLLVVPEFGGKGKAVLEEGTTVEIENSWEDFRQVRTGEKILGWISSRELWM